MTFEEHVAIEWAKMAEAEGHECNFPNNNAGFQGQQSEYKREKRLRKIVSFIHQNPGVGLQEIINGTKLKNGTVRNDLCRLTAVGRLFRHNKNKYHTTPPMEAAE